MLERLDEIKNNGDNSLLTEDTTLNPYPGLRELIVEFIHLVYSFDPNLPLNKLISDMPNVRISINSGGQIVNEVRYYIDFFIHFIEDYCE